MSSNTTTAPYDEERRILSMLVELMEEPEFDGGSGVESESRFVLERLMDLLSLQDDDDADTVSNARPSIPDQEALELEWNMLATPSATLTNHTGLAPTIQAVRPTEQMYRLHVVPAPNCWIGLSVGWPETDVSMEVFGIACWSHTPYISISSPYMLPRNILYPRTHLGSLNGVPECDIPELGSLLYPDSLLPLP